MFVVLCLALAAEQLVQAPSSLASCHWLTHSTLIAFPWLFPIYPFYSSSAPACCLCAIICDWLCLSNFPACGNHVEWRGFSVIFFISYHSTWTRSWRSDSKHSFSSIFFFSDITNNFSLAPTTPFTYMQAGSTRRSGSQGLSSSACHVCPIQFWSPVPSQVLFWPMIMFIVHVLHVFVVFRCS